MLNAATVSFQESFRTFVANIWDTMRSVTPFDILDILMVAFVIYYLFKLVRDTRAMQFVKGIILLLVVYVVTTNLPFKAMGFFMKNLVTIGATALVVVFQPELRRALERVGRSTRLPFGAFGAQQPQEQALVIHRMIDAVCEAGESLSRHKTGALMVVEMQTKLGEIVKTGTELDCKPAPELICNIFFPNSPLHDGAMVLRNGRIIAAGCFLPLTENHDLSKELGTRHRASLGMSENSDAIVVVVSEETGVISVARNGVLTRNYTPKTLGEYMRAEMLPEETDALRERKFPFRRAKK